MKLRLFFIFDKVCNPHQDTCYWSGNGVLSYNPPPSHELKKFDSSVKSPIATTISQELGMLSNCGHFMCELRNSKDMEFMNKTMDVVIWFHKQVNTNCSKHQPVVYL